MKTNFLKGLAIAAVSLLFASCADSQTAETEILTLTVEPKSVQLKVGETKQLTSKITSSLTGDMPTQSVSYISSTPEKATIDDKGLVTAVALGKSEITASIKGTDVSEKITVTVVGDDIHKGEVIDLGDGSNAYEIKSDMTLSYPNTYILKGWVYVCKGATLTIEPGVIIKGDKATKSSLIIERGAKIMAQGEPNKPIIMTSGEPAGSRKSGDWGGLIVCGYAKHNLAEATIEGGVRSKHGGTNDADNSGVLSYIRVEFAGVEYTEGNEINGITFGSVGSKTKVDHIQVSFSGDDSYEWFGGSVNASHLISYRSWDDDYDTDNGFSGKIQFAVGLRDPQIGDQSASNGFESDNNANGSFATPLTSVTFANVSLFGPVANPASYVDEAGVHGSQDPSKVRFQAAMHLRRNTSLNVFNSVFAAFPIGLIIENDKGSNTQKNATDKLLNVSNTVFAGMVKNFQDAQYWTNGTVYNPASDADAFAKAYFSTEALLNMTYTSIADLKLVGNPLDLTSPANMIPQSDSPLSNSAVWTNPIVASGFERVSYKGAFAPTETKEKNWMSGWTEFDPQNAQYE